MFLKNIFLYVLLLTSNNLFAQIADSSVYHKKKHVVIRQFAIPALLIGLGSYGISNNTFINHNEIKEERFEYFPGFTNKADNYVQFAPIAAVFAMDALNLKSKSSVTEQLWLLGKSQVIMFSLVYPLKQWTHIVRPDSSSFNSFPSGHTAQAFLGATFFWKEYGKKSPALGIGMFTVATGIGVFRILNNKHWISDVFAGAGIGIVSVEIADLLPKLAALNKHKMSVSILPSLQNSHFTCTAFVNLP